MEANEESGAISADREPAAERTTAPGLPARISLLLFSPGSLFERLRERPLWIDMLLLLVALNIVGNLILPEELLRQMAERQLPPDADPAAVEGSLRLLRIGSLVGGVIFVPIWAVIVAGYALVVYNVFLAGEATFRQLLSVSVHALFLLTFGSLLTLLLMIASGETGTALAFHLLAPGLDAEGWLYRFLHGLNVFGIWTAVVLGIGIGHLYPRRSAGAAIALMLGTYVVLKAVAATIPALSGS